MVNIPDSDSVSTHVESPAPSAGLVSPRNPADFCWPCLGPFGVLIGLSAFMRMFDIDLLIIRQVVSPGKVRFLAGEALPWQLLYRYGEIPGISLAILGIILAVASLLRRRWNCQGRVGLFLLLACSLGPGLLVNGIMKNQCGRPRPRETLEFGGREHFLPLGDMGHYRTNGSFPSGHAAIAFFVFAPAFLCCRWRWWTPVWLTAGLGFGVLVGIARVLQGGHFPSDVLWSLGVVYFVTLLAARLLQVHRIEICDLWKATPAPELPWLPLRRQPA